VLASSSASAIASSPVSPPTITADRALWDRSDEALQRGERPAAEGALRELLAGYPSSALRDRASLRLAELELARGAEADGRSRLAALVRADDAPLAADAALLLARAHRDAAERAAVWATYLASSPPSPYREQALVERAKALLDAGDVAGAHAVVSALGPPASLPDVVRAPLARVVNRLERERAGAP
jgi:hypothetical protein